ncbi:MAG: metabolite traffic protein EboE [Desulfobacteraceae bacterium]|nr:metabolite traffic protein EboE [Desulfobacteraceae bacterium]
MITYCTNIHEAESWPQTLRNIRKHLPTIKAAVSPKRRFPIGLRLSNRAAFELDDSAVKKFIQWCEQNGCFVPTINGFPYGAFHGQSIKQKVYLPDWRDQRRVAYTKQLATLLHALLPDGLTGSISTVPLGFKRYIQKEDLTLIRNNLEQVLDHFDHLSQSTGKLVLLALEPEPGCVLEKTSDVIRFFEETDRRRPAFEHLGVCLDCCHQAVMFEQGQKILKDLADAAIPVAKIQVSAGLRLKTPDSDVLRTFDEPCYLHQVVVRRQNGSLHYYDDLPLALRDHVNEPGDEWRVHFHVPIFAEHMDMAGTTQSFIRKVLPATEPAVLLEVETYSWAALSARLRVDNLTDFIIRELLWLKGIMKNEANSGH